MTAPFSSRSHNITYTTTVSTYIFFQTQRHVVFQASRWI